MVPYFYKRSADKRSAGGVGMADIEPDLVDYNKMHAAYAALFKNMDMAFKSLTTDPFYQLGF